MKRFWKFFCIYSSVAIMLFLTVLTLKTAFSIKLPKSAASPSPTPVFTPNANVRMSGEKTQAEKKIESFIEYYDKKTGGYIKKKEAEKEQEREQRRASQEVIVIENQNGEIVRTPSSLTQN